MVDIFPYYTKIQRCRNTQPTSDSRILRTLNRARYFNGLDGLRYYSKMGWEYAYEELRDCLLFLPS
ncbi:hypothetical protein D3C76_87940 [compost metagenome]